MWREAGKELRRLLAEGSPPEAWEAVYLLFVAADEAGFGDRTVGEDADRDDGLTAEEQRAIEQDAAIRAGSL
ncbi:hypothetical protein ACFOD4_04690 [Pseudoroseomonas globiformis]|uniref:Uncharacterized protein n=1 Tax=Teichococcus globiformis TaxID=2307229 RepID=A0ABV7FVY8_9PROT